MKFHCYFSKKQKEAIINTTEKNEIYRPIFATINNKRVECTEKIRKGIEKKCNWDDAIYLGESDE